MLGRSWLTALTGAAGAGHLDSEAAFRGGLDTFVGALAEAAGREVVSRPASTGWAQPTSLQPDEAGRPGYQRGP